MPKIHQFIQEECEQVLQRMKTIKNASLYGKLEVLKIEGNPPQKSTRVCFY